MAAKAAGGKIDRPRRGHWTRLVVAALAVPVVVGAALAGAALAGAPVAPSATTEAADAVHIDSARLNGTVNPQGLPTKYHFEFGPTLAYGRSTPDRNAGAGTTDEGVSARISGLAHGSRYHYRLVASNSAGTSHGADQVVTTLDPRLRGRFQIRLHVASGGRAFGQHRGQVLHRTYRFVPSCKHRCPKLRLRRRGQHGRFRSTLDRIRSGVYRGTERFNGGVCDDGLAFRSKSPIRVHVKRTSGDRASRVAGRLRVKAHGCVSGKERASFHGKRRG